MEGILQQTGENIPHVQKPKRKRKKKTEGENVESEACGDKNEELTPGLIDGPAEKGAEPFCHEMSNNMTGAVRGKKRRKMSQELAVATDQNDSVKTNESGRETTHYADVNSADAKVSMKNMEKQRRNIELERQKKIAEANKAIKREKRKQRDKRKEPKDNEETTETHTKKTSPDYAIKYVQQWKENKQAWKFQKAVQTWILQNMLDKSKIEKCHFPLVVEYANSVQGAARKKTVDEMESVLERGDRWSALLEEGKSPEEIAAIVGGDKPRKTVYRRARTLLQSLTDE